MYRYGDGAFYPYSGMSEYIAAGVWPSGGVDVDDVVFAQFSGPAPSMMELGRMLTACLCGWKNLSTQNRASL